MISFAKNKPATTDARTGMAAHGALAPSRGRQAGLTLIELLIGLVITSIVLSGVLALYLQSAEAASVQNAAARVQENGRFAADQLTRVLRMAGYDDPGVNATAPITPALVGSTGADGTLGITGFTLKSSADAVSVSYEGAPLVVNCQGAEVPANAWVTNVFAVSSDDELVCQTQTLISGATTNSAATVIAEGIEDLELLYGVDPDGDGAANRYVTENNVTDWTQVRSVKLALLANSVDGVPLGAIRGCESCNTFNPATDSLLRGEFHSTVRFRNL